LLRKTLVLLLVLFAIFPSLSLRAAPTGSSSKGFSIKPSSEWIELSLPYQGVVASYGKKGTLATFHITERNLEEARTIDQLSWKDLFSPEFGSIDIRTQGTTLLGGEKAKFCVYLLKPGEFKSVMEGKLPGKYINYVLVHQGKLFSITFKDTEDGFSLTYPAFLIAIRTLRFETSLPVAQRKKA